MLIVISQHYSIEVLHAAKPNLMAKYARKLNPFKLSIAPDLHVLRVLYNKY